MRRLKFEKINLKIIAIVAILLYFFTISIGYSVLRQRMNIYGKATIGDSRENTQKTLQMKKENTNINE